MQDIWTFIKQSNKLPVNYTKMKMSKIACESSINNIFGLINYF